MKQLSKTQHNAFINSTARINILQGAVRSGKSFICLLRWIDFCINGPEGALVLCGRTDKTIKRNIIMPLQSIVGNALVYKAGKGEVQFYNRTMYVIGANDDRAETKIRGSQFVGALIDEATLMPENFFKMLLSRLSIPGACLFASTNPDSPFHWLKRDFIDRGDELDIKTFKFNIHDNPSLTEKYIKDISSEYRGLWYKRFILGEWVIADGAVYDFFDDSIHVIPYAESPAEYYIVGIDYGTTNPCVFTMIGYNSQAYPNMWVEKEYYFDSKKELRQKSDYDYVIDYQNFVRGYYVKSTYVDPSAASLKQEMYRNGIKGLLDADNEVVPGIRYVGQLMTNGTLKICRCCENLIKEFSTYVWDTKASMRGEDKPVKQTDHCFAAGSLVSTKLGKVSIEMIKKGDMVLTPIGYKKVIDTFVNEDQVYEYNLFGYQFKCTQSHKFYTVNRGWIEVKDLNKSDTILKMETEVCMKKNNLFLMESDIEGTHTLKIELLESTLHRLWLIKEKDLKVCIEKFGNMQTEKYQKECIYITSTKIPSTMTLVTSVYSLPMNIINYMQKILLNKKSVDYGSIAKEFDDLQKNGMEVMKEKSGILNMENNVLNFQNENVHAYNAIQNMSQENKATQNFVQINVELNTEEIVTLTMSLETAIIAINLLEVTSMQNLSFVQDHVQNYTSGHVEKVYNLHVEECHCYFVNDILVLNCLDSLRYALFTHFFRKTGRGMTQDDVSRLERESNWDYQ